MHNQIGARRYAWPALMAVIALTLGTPQLKALINGWTTGQSLAGDFYHWLAQADIAFNQHLSPYLRQSISASGIATYPSFYPPFNLVIFWPLTLMTPPVALLAQWLANVLCLAALLHIVTTSWAPLRQSPYGVALVLACACVSTAIALNFSEGQVNVELALLVVVAAHRASERPDDPLAGVLLGICALLKFYFILLLPLLLLRRQWRAAAGAAAVLGLALAVTAIFFPGRGWGDWLDFVAGSGFGKAPHGWAVQLFAHNQSLNGYLSTLFGDSKLTRVLGLALSAGIVTATAMAIWLNRSLPARRFWPAALTGVVMATYLIAPLAWLHYFVVHWALAAMLWSAALAAGARAAAAAIACLLVYSSLPWVALMVAPFEPVVRWLPIWATVGLWLAALLPWARAAAVEEK